MNALLKGLGISMILLIMGISVYSSGILDPKSNPSYNIHSWKVAWVQEVDFNTDELHIVPLTGWNDANIGNPMPNRPSGSVDAWIQLQVDPGLQIPQALLMDKIYATNVTVFNESKKIYQSPASNTYNLKKIIIPVDPTRGSTFYIGMHSTNSRIGIMKDEIQVGYYDDLLKSYVKKDVIDFVLGTALIFIAVVMFSCSFFLNMEHKNSWISLSIVILTSGLLVITYSSFLYTFFEISQKGTSWIFDISLFTFLPAMYFFFWKVIGAGRYSIILWCMRVQTLYSLFCFVFLLVNQWSGQQYSDTYSYFTVNIIGYFMILLFTVLMVTALLDAIRGKSEAIIFCIGFVLLAGICISELVQYFASDQKYQVYYWKWGIVCFMLSLIVILGRKFANNHEQVVEYSKRLVIFNDELQRSEKMEIISELAASVAHEVRNPLQVTRGFLQLLAEKQQSQDKVYLNMALEELDRASGIITDFLTFAKPEVAKFTSLNILDEFIHIEGILIPMANLQGGKISTEIPEHLYVRGNSSKFKQALINIIKNSIEALNGEGDIRIWAYAKQGNVYIHVRDSGEGMTPMEVSRLGEPYFSNKSKGTGLGLMVTFSIIEVMEGELTFVSEKGVGTEAIIRFPEDIE
ncbi:signal transduction histidine kinase [Paenibacillus shirakamiensis]|uniref:histidine kinase n=1 Tax=Paenibacillus shirakamiensis TaxID=1265935 RepID=A0ABS4JHX9_9BACL|nr:HAMP domain-containing sensor histidine kinase [Paenibacillus shirakamiensis]MBP2000716.1 signal transduction histidine kinase [Paenibacillus shirakamiensis]